MNLQAYSVFLALKNQYPDAEVELIRYHSWFAIWRIYLSSMTFSSLVQEFVQFYKYSKFKKSFKLSKKTLVTLDADKAYEFIQSLNYDAIYVGSDTLLELFRVPSSDITAYWLSDKISAKKFMVAASARDTSFNKLSDLQKQKLQQSVDSFKMLGVRDSATFQLIQNFVPENDPRLKIIPDPTFYFDIDYSYAQKYVNKKGLLRSGRPIICFHMLKSNDFASELADKLRKDGYLIASLRPAKYADFILKDLSPLEFAGIFKFFSFTITHRFHDSVFSIKNLCPLLLFQPTLEYQNELGNSKQSSLMDSFMLKETNFIQDISKLNADNLFIKIKTATNSFEMSRDKIEKQLSVYKNEFEQYVSETANIK